MEGWGGFNGYIYVIVLSNIGMFVRITFLRSGTSTLPYKTVKSYFDIIYDYFFFRNQRRNQTDFNSEMEFKDDFDNATKIPSSGYI